MAERKSAPSGVPRLCLKMMKAVLVAASGIARSWCVLLWGHIVFKRADFGAFLLFIRTNFAEAQELAAATAGSTLFTGAYTVTGPGARMRHPWSGYPGYTSVQYADFDDAGESAFMLRAA